VQDNFARLIPDFAALVGDSNVVIDDIERAYYSQDYFREGPLTLAVIRPANLQQLSSVVSLATKQGLAVYPRGAGYSYTDGYLVTKPGITIDMSGMRKILEINPIDMYVTVEAGCTWSDLDDALKPHDLRVPFWGPLSGLRATVGGAISQGAISLGSAKYGVSAESVLALDVVTADGRVLKTGSSGQPGHSPFFRNYGPDLTGNFCGDCGALGLKAHVTLRLIRRPRHVAGLSFGFDSFEGLVKASAAVAREGIVVDCLGMRASVIQEAMQSGNLISNLQALWKVAKAASGPFDAVMRSVKIAVAGRGFLRNIEQTLHFSIEGPNTESIQGQAKAVRVAVGRLGREIPNTVPTVMRSAPFREYDMLSPIGKRQLPPSTILPFSAVVEFDRDFRAAVQKYEVAMVKHHMSVFPVYATVGTNGFLYEPVIAWHDNVNEFHRRHTAANVLKQAEGRQADPAARELAIRIRTEMIDLAFKHGGVHLQIGKVYPYLKERDSSARAALQSLKSLLDPQGLMNPGALGLPAQD
jgi:FAD/FMN-containing dehydrogenase